MEPAVQSIEDTSYELPYSLLEFVRRSRSDIVSLYHPPLFLRGLLYKRILFLGIFNVGKPEYIEHVLLTNYRNYAKSALARRVGKPIFGDGLFTSEGDFWRRQRRIIAPAFHQKRIASFVETMSACTGAMIERWQGRQGSFDVLPEMSRLTMEIIARTMFFTDVADDAGMLGRNVDILVTQLRPGVGDLLGFPEWVPSLRPRSVQKAVAEVDELITRIISQRRANPGDHEDLLTLLLQARDPDTGVGMSDRQLRDEVATIIGAGHETTATALSWTWYLLSQHPAVEARLHEEVDRVLAGRRCGLADLPRLSYARMVFEEAMRLYPPAHSIPRVALAEDSMGGVRVPRGSLMMISPYVTHRNPDLWPDPDRFDPERFTPEAAAARHRFAYLPFGGGPRVCIGSSFAMAEAVVIMSMVAQHYRLRLDSSRPVTPCGYITLRPKEGIWVSLEARTNQSISGRS